MTTHLDPGPGARAAGRVARLLVAASLLAGVLLAVAQAPAMACSCAQRDLQEQADAADVVLSGTVETSARERVDPGRPKSDRLTLTVAVDRVYKGTVARESVEVSAPASRNLCGLGTVPTDERWFIFATAKGSALSTTSCTGTATATADYTAQVEQVLGEGSGRGGAASEAAPPTRTPVQDGPPPDFGRTAAPGGALAIVGLLGLLLVRRRARRG